jgi:hypothetical protein
MDTTKNLSRLSRDTQTREANTRPKVWKPADLLPEPTRQEGWEYKWIRKSIMGVSDPTNMSKSLREGWEPCRLEDHPEMMLAIDGDAKNSGLIEVGGLVLCKIPQEMFDQRQAYYMNQAQGQMESVDAQVDRENDKRMPIFNERQTKVVFGNGR